MLLAVCCISACVQSVFTAITLVQAVNAYHKRNGRFMIYGEICLFPVTSNLRVSK